MKKFLLRLFLRDKFLGQIAQAVAAAAASYAMTYIPGAPEIIEVIVRALLQMPDGTELTHAGLAAALAPIVLALINAVVQEIVTRDNNTVLKELKTFGPYDGKIDGWVGPDAKAAVEKLLGLKN
jgi:hypothetical protein